MASIKVETSVNLDSNFSVSFEENDGLFNQIKNILKKIETDQAPVQIVNNFQILQKAALIFLTQTNEILENQKTALNNIVRLVKKGTHYTVAVKEIYDIMQKDERVTNLLTIEQDKFQSAINNFNNTIMGLIYMNTDTGEIIARSEVEMQEIYKKYVTNKISSTNIFPRGRGTVNVYENFEQIKTLEGRNKYWEQLEKILNQRSSYYQYILDTALGRWEYQNMKYKEDSKFSNTFYWWQLNPKNLGWIAWTSKKYTNRGKIVEGYMRALFQENPFPEADQEKRVATLAEYVDESDNIGASFTQDLSIKMNQSKIDLAVKSGPFFSTAGFRQYLRIAIAIIGIENESDIKKIFKNKKFTLTEFNNEKIESAIANIMGNFLLKNLI